jgi:HK97 family phage prohead protease
MNIPEGFERELGPGGLEQRTVAADRTEARAATDQTGPIVAGLGSVYGQTTTIPGFFSDWDEEVVAGAWTETIKTGDIRSMMNHDTNWLLGRTTSGSLRLTDTADGLHYEIDINPDDPNAMTVHARVARGDISGSSVWFRVIKERWTEPTDSNGLERPLRQILQARLFEVGPVVFPAFPQTTSAARTLDGVLRAAGVTNDTRRAEVAFEILSDPDRAEPRIRELFARNPDLQARACNAVPGTADPSAVADESQSRTHPSIALRRRRLAMKAS